MPINCVNNHFPTLSGNISPCGLNNYFQYCLPTNAEPECICSRPLLKRSLTIDSCSQCNSCDSSRRSSLVRSMTLGSTPSLWLPPQISSTNELEQKFLKYSHTGPHYYGYDSEYSGAETEIHFSDRSFDSQSIDIPEKLLSSQNSHLNFKYRKSNSISEPPQHLMEDGDECVYNLEVKSALAERLKACHSVEVLGSYKNNNNSKNNLVFNNCKSSPLTNNHDFNVEADVHSKPSSGIIQRKESIQNYGKNLGHQRVSKRNSIAVMSRINPTVEYCGNNMNATNDRHNIFAQNRRHSVAVIESQTLLVPEMRNSFLPSDNPREDIIAGSDKHIQIAAVRHNSITPTCCNNPVQAVCSSNCNQNWPTEQLKSLPKVSALKNRRFTIAVPEKSLFKGLLMEERSHSDFALHQKGNKMKINAQTSIADKDKITGKSVTFYGDENSSQNSDHSNYETYIGNSCLPLNNESNPSEVREAADGTCSNFCPYGSKQTISCACNSSNCDTVRELADGMSMDQISRKFGNLSHMGRCCNLTHYYDRTGTLHSTNASVANSSPFPMSPLSPSQHFNTEPHRSSDYGSGGSGGVQRMMSHHGSGGSNSSSSKRGTFTRSVSNADVPPDEKTGKFQIQFYFIIEY